jgi:hypothetical protein
VTVTHTYTFRRPNPDGGFLVRQAELPAGTLTFDGLWAAEGAEHLTVEISPYFSAELTIGGDIPLADQLASERADFAARARRAREGGYLLQAD